MKNNILYNKKNKLINNIKKNRLKCNELNKIIYIDLISNRNNNEKIFLGQNINNIFQYNYYFYFICYYLDITNFKIKKIIKLNDNYYINKVLSFKNDKILAIIELDTIHFYYFESKDGIIKKNKQC